MQGTGTAVKLGRGLLNSAGFVDLMQIINREAAEQCKVEVQLEGFSDRREGQNGNWCLWKKALRSTGRYRLDTEGAG